MSTTYTLGHEDSEVRRLLLQGRVYRADTKHALQLAGLKPGMRVLDVGCGPGDVSLLAAELVGPTGSVHGVDAADVVHLARSRAADQGVTNVSFTQSALDELVLEEPVDAVIGRLILMHLPDPAAALRRLAGLVRPGGVVAFAENDIATVRSYPDIPLFQTVTGAVARSFEALGLDISFGPKLGALFQEAGLGIPKMAVGAPMGGADDIDLLTYAAEIWRLVYPVADGLGLTAGVPTPDELLPLLQREVEAARASVMMPPQITAWAQVR
ncbi:class I SAM-dependent methyltransferase [Mycolicibacterium sp. Dal123E01]|uniref:class I SAM-dependent methyltransferase n=1 Tax=Mycolicibacterium sp. Dal123E01 TaxID=3457578 RepID=UPI00403EABE0